MNFSLLPNNDNPYAGKNDNGDWIEGTISIGFLSTHFGSYATANEMIASTDSEGLKLYFQWLKDQGLLN